MDWTRLISDLVAAGLTQASIARALGVSQPTIWALASGRIKDPRWRIGNKLIELYKGVCGEPQAAEN